MISRRRKKTQFLFAIFWFHDFFPSGEIHDPDVEPEDIRGIFNEYTEEQVLASDIMKLPLPQFLKQKVSYNIWKNCRWIVWKAKIQRVLDSHFLKYAFAFQTSKEATEEEVEESRQSKKETIKKSSSTSIVSCSTCKKQVPKSNIELHKLKCTSDLRPLLPTSSTSNSTVSQIISKISFRIRNFL